MPTNIYGKNHLATIQFPHLQKAVTFNYWDLWIAIIVENKCSGDWETLKEVLEQRKDGNGRDAYEELLSQVVHAQEKLEQNKIQPLELLEKIQEVTGEADFIKQQQRRASRKVLSFMFTDKDKTEAMENTPRKVKIKSALHGALTYSDGIGKKYLPSDYVTIFNKKYRKVGFYRKGQTFALEKKLQDNLDKLTKKASASKLFAIYRGFLTVVIEKTEMIDDSFGNIGTLAQDVFKLYIDLDKSVLEVTPEDFYTDLFNLMLWEDYGYFDEHYPVIFEKIPAEEVELVEHILLSEKAVLEEGGYDYRLKVAARFLSYL